MFRSLCLVSLLSGNVALAANVIKVSPLQVKSRSFVVDGKSYVVPGGYQGLAGASESIKLHCTSMLMYSTYGSGHITSVK